MPTQIKNDATAPWFLEHPFSAEDQTAMAAMRAIVTPNKGKLQGIQARVPFGGIMERVVAPEAIDYVADKIGGVPGWWCRRRG